MADTELKVIVKAKELMKHTYVLTSNANRYPKKFRHSLVDRMQIASMDIYELLLEAKLKLDDVEKKAIEFIEGVEKDFKVKVKSCYVDDNYYTTINSLNDWRYIFDSAAHIKSTMPLEDRPLMLTKLMAQGRYKLVDGECESLVFQLSNAVFDDKNEKAIICDDGSMNIDVIDAFFYSIADDYLYLV